MKEDRLTTEQYCGLMQHYDDTIAHLQSKRRELVARWRRTEHPAKWAIYQRADDLQKQMQQVQNKS